MNWCKDPNCSSNLILMLISSETPILPRYAISGRVTNILHRTATRWRTQREYLPRTSNSKLFVTDMLTAVLFSIPKPSGGAHMTKDYTLGEPLLPQQGSTEGLESMSWKLETVDYFINKKRFYNRIYSVIWLSHGVYIKSNLNGNFT